MNSDPVFNFPYCDTDTKLIYVSRFFEKYPFMRNVSQEDLLEGFYYFLFDNGKPEFVDAFCYSKIKIVDV